MPKRRPDVRYLTIRSNSKTAPRHPLERALWRMLHRNGSHPTVGYALEIYTNGYEREVLQAWLLAGADNEQLQRHLRLPPEVTEAYRHLFFDVGLFRDELDLLSWIHECGQTQQLTPHGAQLLKMAMQGGVDSLAWLYGRGEFAVSSEKVAKHVMTDAFFRGQANRGHSVSSKEAAAAHAFYLTAVKIAQRLTQKVETDVSAIRVQLLYRDLTAPLESLPPGEVMQ